MTDRTKLEAWFRGAGQALLGYSGGVDSAVLAVTGSRVLGPDRFMAVIGRSASYPEQQWRVATDLAARFDVPVMEIDTDELADPRYRANPIDRCYYCKTELWARLTDIAGARGFRVIIDGTNADDMSEHRPGAVAGRERGVRSPFVELSWTKANVRAVARDLDLPTWDSPSSPCLSSRIAYGLEVTTERLAQVELAEGFLRTLGVEGDLRVRHHGDRVRIEVAPERFALIDHHWDAIQRRFTEIGLARVERDQRGYRRGGLLPVAS